MANNNDPDDSPEPEIQRVAEPILRPDELLPHARERYDALVKEHGGEALPIHVRLPDDAGMRIAKTMDGKPFVMVSEENRRWTEELLRERIKLSDEVVATLQPVTDPEVLAAFAVMAEKSNIHPPPRLLLFAEETGVGGQAGMTSDGVKYVVLDPLPPVVQLAVSGHELGHIVLGHIEVAATVEEHNDETRQISKAHERAADAYAIAMGRGNDLADYVEQNAKKAEAIALEEGATLDQVLARNRDHPSHNERIEYLRGGAKTHTQAPLPESQQEAANAMEQSLRGMDVAAFARLSGGEHVAEHGVPGAGGGRSSVNQVG